MTVTAEVLSEQYAGNGVTTSFDYRFKLFASSELVVREIVTATGVATLRTAGTHYSVTGVGEDEGGTVEFVSAPASGITVDLRPVYQGLQPSSFRNQGKFLPESHESAFDRRALNDQMLLRLIRRCLHLPDYGEDDALLELPYARAGKFLAFDVDKEPVASDGTGADAGLRTDLASSVVSNDGALLVGYRRPETGAVGRAIAAVLRGMMFVEDFGAVGDNVTNDLVALQTAMTAFEQSTAATLVFQPGRTYYLGDVTAAAVLLQLDGVVGKRICGNGARLRCNTTDSSAPIMLQLNDCRGVVIEQLRVKDDGWNTAVPSGVVAFDVRASGATDEDIGHISFEDCEVDQGVMFLRVAGNVTGEVSTNQVNRIRNVRVRGCRSFRTFYAVNLQNHGDDCSVDMFCEDLHRTMFGYGVTGLDFSLHVKNPRGGFAHVLCKAYDRSTEGWRGRIYLESAVSGFEAVAFEFQNDTQTQSIRDIEIDLSMRNTASGATPVTFRAFEANGTPRATTTNRWDNIRLRGEWTGFTTPFVFTTRQTTEGRLFLDPSLANQIPTFTDWSGFVLQTAIDEEVRTVTGNLTTSTITIPCARYDAQAFELEVTTCLRDPTDGATSAAATLTERVIIKASNSGSGGAVSILDTLQLLRFTRASASVPTLGTITYTASGENINVTFSTHTHASSHARVAVKHLRGYC